MILNLIKFAFSERKFSDGEDMTNREGLFWASHSINSILDLFQIRKWFPNFTVSQNYLQLKIPNLYKEYADNLNTYVAWLII